VEKAALTNQPQSPESKNQKLAVSIGRNTFFGMVSRGAQVATRLVTIPIVIAHLGLDGYGIWSIVMTAAAYMRFGSVGIKSAFQKYVAEATGNGDYEQANQLLSTGCAIMALLSTAALIPIAIFSEQVAKASGVPAEFLHSASQAFTVLALIMMLSNVGAVFEAIVMGGHRIDLARNFTTFFTVAEAVAIVVLLHFGYGLFGMATVMAVSEGGFIICCYFASRRIVPQIRIRLAYVTRSVLYELFRYAGSYQLVNVLEVVYNAILPIAILRVFGANASGEYALVTRLVSAVLMLPDAFLVPILSGGTMVSASGSVEGMRTLIVKSYKVTLCLTLFPLAFVGAFGGTIMLAWTGQTGPSFQGALWLVCGAGFFSTFSMLQLVLYRVSGKAVMDNIRQVLRIVTLLIIAVFARQLGFYGVLSGLIVAEAIGMFFMLFAITKTFEAFEAKSLLPDTVKLALASAAMIAAGYAAVQLPLPDGFETRVLATLQVATIALACLLAAWPAFRLTRAISDAEMKAVLGTLVPRRTLS
jgi:O-antigen/teichoic acid export membrane protein